MSSASPKSTILFLSANPRSTAQLKIDEESRLVRNRISAARYRDQLDFQPRTALRAGELQRELRDTEPTIVHFSGHGAGTGELLFMRDGTDAPQPIAPELLAQVFELFSSHVQCVLLNACYSEIQAQAIVRSIPVVIGMSRAVADETALTFATGFYEALAFGSSVLDAYKSGLNQIGLELTAEGDPDGHKVPRLLKKEGVDPAKMFIVKKPKPQTEAPSIPKPPSANDLLAQILGEAAKGGGSIQVNEIKSIIAKDQGHTEINQKAGSNTPTTGSNIQINKADRVISSGAGSVVKIDQESGLAGTKPAPSPKEKALELLAGLRASVSQSTQVSKFVKPGIDGQLAGLKEAIEQSAGLSDIQPLLDVLEAGLAVAAEPLQKLRALIETIKQIAR